MVYDKTVGERIGGIRVGLGAAIGNFLDGDMILCCIHVSYTVDT